MEKFKEFSNQINTLFGHKVARPSDKQSCMEGYDYLEYPSEIEKIAQEFGLSKTNPTPTRKEWVVFVTDEDLKKAQKALDAQRWADYA